MKLIKLRRMIWNKLPTNLRTRESIQQQRFRLKSSGEGPVGKRIVSRQLEDSNKIGLKEVRYCEVCIEISRVRIAGFLGHHNEYPPSVKQLLSYLGE
jgi:hypothetical protein